MDVISRKTILRELLSEKRQQKEKAEADADRVRLRIAEKVPVYGDMSGAITSILMEASRRALETPAQGEQIGQEAKAKVEALRQQSEAALLKAGYSLAMLEPKYNCPLCKDTGFVGTPIHEYCTCVKVEMMRRLYERANIGEETFEKFDLNVFSDEKPEGGRSQREVMETYRNYCQAYADRYPNVRRRNLLLTGQTGLGKTYMLNCIAARMLDRGTAVLRLTAYKMLDAMRRLHRGLDEDGMDTMLTAELLIIDDLGTEPMLENVTIEYLFSLLNERQEARLPTLIATNLTPRELQTRYTERIFSRMVDTSQTEVLRFVGNDVRLHR